MPVKGLPPSAPPRPSAAEQMRRQELESKVLNWAPAPQPVDPNAPPPEPLTPDQMERGREKMRQVNQALGNVLDTMHRTDMNAIRPVRVSTAELAERRLAEAQRAPGWQQLSADKREAFDARMRSEGQEGHVARQDFDELRGRGFDSWEPDRQARALESVTNPPDNYVAEAVREGDAYKSLPPGDQKALDLALRRRSSRNQSQTASAMMSTKGWQELSTEGRADALKNLARRSIGVEGMDGVFGKAGVSQKMSGADAVAHVESQPGFEKLTSREQERTRALLGGETNALSKRARETYADVASDPVFQVMNGDEQAAYLKDLPRRAVDRQFHTEAYDMEHGASERVGEPEVKGAREGSFQFESGHTLPAHQISLDFDGHSVDVIMPKERYTPEMPTFEQVKAGLSEMDRTSLKSIDKVIVHPRDYSQDKYLQSAFNDPTLRAHMTVGLDDPSTVDVYPAARDSATEFAQMATHEAGHTRSLERWSGKVKDGDMTGGAWDRWRAAADADGVAPSYYAKSKVAEDVAEAWSVYARTKGTPAHDELRQIFPNRFAMLDRLDEPSLHDLQMHTVRNLR